MLDLNRAAWRDRQVLTPVRLRRSAQWRDMARSGVAGGGTTGARAHSYTECSALGLCAKGGRSWIPNQKLRVFEGMSHTCIQLCPPHCIVAGTGPLMMRELGHRRRGNTLGVPSLTLGPQVLVSVLGLERTGGAAASNRWTCVWGTGRVTGCNVGTLISRVLW